MANDNYKITLPIQKKLLYIFIALVIFPSSFIGFSTYYNAKIDIQNNQIAKLEALTDLKRTRIETFFENMREDMQGAESFWNIKRNLPILKLYENRRISAQFMNAEGILDSQFKPYAISKNLFDFILLSNDKKMLYHTNAGNDSIDFNNPILSRYKTLLESAKNQIVVSDLIKYGSSSLESVMFVAGPARDMDGRNIGIIVFLVESAPLYSLIQETTGLGKTGETLIAKKVGNTVVFLNPLRHDINAAFNREVSVGSRDAVPAQNAVLGKNGSGISIDYRGKQVISAWRYIPALDIGLVSKIDTDEAFYGIRKLQILFVLLMSFVVVIGSFISIVIAKSIADPIHALHKGTEIIGSGNLDYKVGSDSRDEIGQLSRAFDRMVVDLKESRDRAIRSEKLAVIGKLAGIMGHEIRNPLGVIRNAVYFLNLKYKDSMDEKVKKYMDIMQAEIGNADRIIEDMLSFARRKEPVLVLTDINQLLEETMGKIPLPEKISTRKYLDRDLSKIMVDSLQIGQVFYNLILNAFQSMSDGGELDIQTFASGEYIVIAFKDTGIGIPEENLGKIFEPLFSTKAKGTGLGLASCKIIIDAHKGKIEVSSEVGKGTVISVFLPKL